MISIAGLILFHLLHPVEPSWSPFRNFTPVHAEAPAPLSESAKRMIAGDIEFTDPSVLYDPCSWVVRVDKGTATIYSRRLMVTRRVTNQGWHAAQFIGACDVSTVGPVTEDLLIKKELPKFPWGAR